MPICSEWFEYFGGLANKIEGAVIPIDKPEMFNFAKHEPWVVVACIVPWNSPILLLSWKLAAALAAGNTAVIKPSEFASASRLELARLFEKAGFPEGRQYGHRLRQRGGRAVGGAPARSQSRVHGRGNRWP